LWPLTPSQSRVNEFKTQTRDFQEPPCNRQNTGSPRNTEKTVTAFSPNKCFRYAIDLAWVSLHTVCFRWKLEANVFETEANSFCNFVLHPLTPWKFFSQTKNGSKTQFVFALLSDRYDPFKGSRTRVLRNQMLSFCIRYKIKYLGLPAYRQDRL